MKECPKCKQSKSLVDFGKDSKRIDGLQRVCRPCKAEYDKKHYEKNPKAYWEKNYGYQLVNKEFILRYKKIFGKCVDCGTTDHRVLEFDHVRGTKLFNLSDGQKYGMVKIKNEIRKCECRCANCHRIKTAERRNKTKK